VEANASKPGNPGWGQQLPVQDGEMLTEYVLGIGLGSSFVVPKVTTTSSCWPSLIVRGSPPTALPFT